LADWVKYLSTGTLATYQYDPATIKKDGDMVRVWVYVELDRLVKEVGKETEPGERSSRALREIDCKERRMRTLRSIVFSGPMMSGEISAEHSVGKWRDAPDSPLVKIVCK
jgi:hypothetical protein